ncbi:MAG: phosphate ABC transporter, permease protein PstA, partial [Eubacterium sp.]
MNKLKTYLRHPMSFAVYLLILLASVITVFAVVFIIAYILIKGIPNLTPELFALKHTSSNHSMLPSIFNTLLLTFFTLLLAVPIGIFSAVFLVEYAKRG